MIKHIVAWSFKNEIQENQKEKYANRIKSELESLKNIIPEIVKIEVYTQLAQTSNRDMMLYSEFETAEALADYQIHPEHKKVSEFVRSVMTERVCLDYFD